MGSTRRRCALIGLLAAGLGAVTGCGSGADTSRAGSTLIDAEDQAPLILNVLLPDGARVVTQHIVSNIQQNLLTSDEHGAFVPQLATSVPAGADVRSGPLRATFHLNPKARWSDGRPVTSADVDFTWRTMTDPRNMVASQVGWRRIRAIRAGRTASGGHCPTATCFTAVFSGDYAPWKDVFSVSGGNYILPEHILRGADFNTVWNDGGIVGSGPFTLESYEPGVRAVLRRSPSYWGEGPPAGRAPVERIVMEFRASSAAAVAAVRNGEAQMTSPQPDPALIAGARQIGGVEVESVPSLFSENIILNTQMPPLDDPRVRRALAFSIDRTEIVHVLLDDTVPVLQSPIGPGQLGYAPAFSRYRYDPRQAAAILTAAGWTRNGDGIFAKAGHELRIPLVTDAGNELRATTAKLIAHQARAAGILVEPRTLPPDQAFGAPIVRGEFTALMQAIGGGVDPSLTGLLASDQIPTEDNDLNGQNLYRWTDLEADRLMRLSDRQIDEAARSVTLHRLQEVIASEVPLIPLYRQPNTVAHVDALSGVKENPTQAEVFWNSGEWSLGGAPPG